MRIRSILPEFWKDELVGRWPAIVRLVYIGLWSEADDFGRVRWMPDYLRASILPYDTRLDMRKVLGQLEADRRVFTYQVQGMPYAVLVNFHKHQRINRKSKPRLPDPPRDELKKFVEDSLKAQCGLTECSVSTHEYFHEDSVSPQRPSRAGAEQGAGSREQGAGSRGASREPPRLGEDGEPEDAVSFVGQLHGLFQGAHPSCEAVGSVAFEACVMEARREGRSWAEVLEGVEAFCRRVPGADRLRMPLGTLENHLRGRTAGLGAGNSEKIEGPPRDVVTAAELRRRREEE